MYRITALNPRTGWRSPRGYFGKTTRDPWTKRLEEHLWGPTAKAWADTVPGWRPNGSVHEVIAAGGARPVVSFTMVPLVLTLLERLIIVCGRPIYNDKDNRGNRRRVTIVEAKRQRRMRDVQRRVPALGAVARWMRLCRQLATAGLVVTVVVAVLMAMV